MFKEKWHAQVAGIQWKNAPVLTSDPKKWLEMQASSALRFNDRQFEKEYLQSPIVTWDPLTRTVTGTIRVTEEQLVYGTQSPIDNTSES